jgi:diacylglycerol kinase (ATP)
MKVLILHSTRAGSRRFSKGQLKRVFEQADHDVRYRSIHKPHWKRRLPKADVVVAVGGDGTVARVAVALSKLGRKAPPLGVIPAGRANNIARALGAWPSPSRLAAALENAAHARLTIGLVRSPWGKARFVESAGIGPLAALLRTDVPTLQGAVRFMRDEFRHGRALEVGIRVGKRRLDGRYIMVHVMNIDAVGPRLALAPGADPGDARLDLVLLGEAQRAAFNDYLAKVAAGKPARCPLVSVRAREIEITPWPAGDGGHVDDKRWPERKRPKRGTVRIQVETSISVLVPRG